MDGVGICLRAWPLPREGAVGKGAVVETGAVSGGSKPGADVKADTRCPVWAGRLMVSGLKRLSASRANAAFIAVRRAAGITFTPLLTGPDHHVVAPVLGSPQEMDALLAAAEAHTGPSAMRHRAVLARRTVPNRYATAPRLVG